MRADARRNREQILAAAREVLLERGADAPFDEIARRAGVGIATLYRRVPDRPSLLRGIALDLLGRAAPEAHAAEAEEPDAFRALARYLHRALDLRISAIMPALLGHVSFDDADIAPARQDAVAPILGLIKTAQAEGSVRADVAFGDIGPLLVRLSRPLPGPVPPALDLQLAHRQLALVLDGLRGVLGPRSTETLPGPAMGLADLQNLARERGPQPPALLRD